MSTPIPCKRPKVDISTEAVASGPLAHRARCLVPGCSWGYGPAVKTDAEQQATWHRAGHRAAVPKAEIVGPTVNLNYRAVCACGWMSADGTNTRTDNEASLANHLSTVHGLVSCS